MQKNNRLIDKNETHENIFQFENNGCNHQLSKNSVTIINAIFIKITVLCPAWNTSVIDDKAEWVRRYKKELYQSLMHHGVKTRQQILLGLAHLRTQGKPFMPSPSAFAMYCRGRDPDSPKLGAAYSIRQKNNRTIPSLSVRKQHLKQLRLTCAL